MKPQFLIFCLVAIILLSELIIPVSAETSTISSVNPSEAYAGTTTTIITVSGTNFNTTLVSVRLMKTNQKNITATISSHSSTTIKCKFIIPSNAAIGMWDVVVVNRDNSEVVDPEGFTIRKTMTLSSISPSSAQTNNDSAKVTVVGTGLSDVENMYLYSSGYSNISAVLNDVESTKVVGTFDLTDANIDTYKICVTDSVETIKCGLEFDIITDEVGSIDIESSPSGAKVYLDSEYMGTSPRTLEDVSLGSHKITISYAGYNDYTKWVTVKADSTVSVSADLNQIETAATTKVPTVATTKTPLKANTVKVPTSWPTPAPTQTSLDATLVLGAITLGILVLHRKSL
jgi:PEGA domain/IPT/TIG domain